MKKDVLFLCQFFYPEYVSSATLPFDTAEALVRAGFTVEALCGYPREYTDKKNVPKREDVKGIHIKRLRYIQLKRSSFIGRALNYFSFTASVLFHLRYFKNFKAVVVYSNPPILPWAACVAKRLFGCRLIFVAYDLYPEIAVRSGSIGQNGFIKRVMDRINRRVFPNADRVVALSGEMKEYIAANRNIPADRIYCIPNWYEDVGADRTARDGENSFYGLFAGRTVVSYLGNMGICQDVDTVLDAARAMRGDGDVRFLFAGHGKKAESVASTVESEGLDNVVVRGFLNGKDYTDALAVSSFAVVSLEKGLTGLCCPSKAYAYMMSGIPIIVIMDGNSDLARDALEGGAGFVVKNGDGEGLAAKIRSAISDGKAYAEMSKNSRRIFLEKYEKQHCLAQYKDMIEKLIGCEQ